MRLVLVFLAVASALLASCASQPPGNDRQAQAEPRREPTTASDQPEAQRRARLRLELAGGYFGRNQHATALDEVKLALAAWPEFGAAFNLRGLIYSAMGEEALALESFRRALQVDPRDADAMHNFAWVHCQARRFVQADALFEQALAQPQYRDTQRTLLAQGVCAARNGQWAKAEAHLSRAYELDAGNPAAGYNLAEVLLRQGQLERARFLVRRVNDNADQANAQTLWLAARIEARAGNMDRAREWGGRLAQRFPQSPEAGRYERGQFDE